MLDISRLSARYGVRRMSDADADAVIEAANRYQVP